VSLVAAGASVREIAAALRVDRDEVVTLLIGIIRR